MQLNNLTHLSQKKIFDIHIKKSKACGNIFKSLHYTHPNVLCLSPLTTIVFEDVSMNRMHAADRQNGRRRDQKDDGGAIIRASNAPTPRDLVVFFVSVCILAEVGGRGERGRKEKEDGERHGSLSTCCTNPRIRRPPCRLTRQSTIAHWICEIVGVAISRPIGPRPIFSPPHPTGAVQQRRQAQNPSLLHGFVPDVRSMSRKVSVGVLLVSTPTGLVFVRHQVWAGVQDPFPDWRFVIIKTPKNFFFYNWRNRIDI